MSARYYLLASQNVIVGGQKYLAGEYLKTPKGRYRSFKNFEGAIEYKHKYVGDSDFPVLPDCRDVPPNFRLSKYVDSPTV